MEQENNFPTIDKLVTVKSCLSNIANRVAGVENFLCDMEQESKNQTYRIAVLIDSVQHILDDLEEEGIKALSGVVMELEGGAA